METSLVGTGLREGACGRATLAAASCGCSLALPTPPTRSEVSAHQRRAPQPRTPRSEIFGSERRAPLPRTPRLRRRAGRTGVVHTAGRNSVLERDALYSGALMSLVKGFQ